MNVRDSMRARYSALSTPASSASKRQRPKAPLFGHKSAAERVNRYKTEQQNLKNTERQKLALENASLKDEVYHLQLKLANAIKKESILKSKRRDVDRQLMSASSLSSHSRSPRSRSSSRRTEGVEVAILKVHNDPVQHQAHEAHEADTPTLDLHFVRSLLHMNFRSILPSVVQNVHQ